MKDNISSCRPSIFKLIFKFFWYLLPDVFIEIIRWSAILLVVIAVVKAIIPHQVMILDSFSPLVLLTSGGMLIMISTTNWKSFKGVKEKLLFFFYRTGATLALVFGITLIYRLIKSAIHLDANWSVLGVNLLLLIIALAIAIIFGIWRQNNASKI